MPRDKQIQLRHGTAAEWTSANPILASGEFGWEKDTILAKLGDGVTAWNSLAYITNWGSGGGGGTTWGSITGTLSNQTDLQAALDLKADISSLATVATSGDYNDLSNTPTNLSDFTNDQGFITASSADTLTNKSGNISQWTNDAGYLLSAPVDSVNGQTGVVVLGIDDLSDVDTSTISPVVGDTLEWDGSNWVPAAPEETDLMPYCATGSGTNVTGTLTTVDLSTEQIANANYSLSASEITVTDAGIYDISYAIQIDEDSTGGGTRGRITGSVEINGTPVTQSYNSVYTREASGGTGVSNSFNVTLSANDVVRLRVQQDGTATPDMSVERSQLSMSSQEGGDSPRHFDNTIIVKSASDLSGTLSSTKNYMIDGAIDMGTQSIEVPEGGLSLSGLNGARDTSILYSTENSYTMFTTPSGGYSGNLVLESCTVDVTGTSSQVFDLDNDGNSSALDITNVNFGRSPLSRLTSLGSLTDYRQILMNGVGFIFMDDGLTFNGTWTGMAVVTTIAVDFANGATLFKEGTSLTFSGSVRTNINFLSVGANSVLFDFDEANILADGGFDLIDARSGADDGVPNITGSSVKARFRDCLGIRNTYVGGEYTISSTTTTVISSANTLVKMAGTTTYNDLQWFSNTTNNAFVYDSSEEIEIEVEGSLSFTNSANKTMGLQVRQWDDSAGSYVNVGARFSATIGAGGRAENLTFFARTTINENDRIEIWIENQSDTSNITAELGGFVGIAERPS